MSVGGSVCPGGVYLGLSAQGGMPGCVCGGGDCLGGVCPGGVCLEGAVCRMPPVDRQAPLKILPCPKLRLRAVITKIHTALIIHVRLKCY